jgi:hypothetical protein
MLPRRRCPFCRRWYNPDPRLKERQQTCGNAECRREHKQESNRQWRAKNPEYFRGVYPHQKEKYGTRAEYMRHYREQHPDYVQRNAAFVRKLRQQVRRTAVSCANPEVQSKAFGSKRLPTEYAVSHTSRDIDVNLVPATIYWQVPT